ncbi:MAG: Rieske (2Fe-2S) protein [Rhodospirillales bacterium]
MTELAALASIPDGAARGVTVEQGGAKRELIVARRGGRVFAYVNACPHLGTPLDIFPDKVLDHTGARLVCSTHGAAFRVADGFCVRGPCAGRSLARVPVELRGGGVFLAGPVPPAPVPME